MSSHFNNWKFVVLICFIASLNGQLLMAATSNGFLFGFPLNYYGATSLQLYIHAQKSIATFNITTIDGSFEYTGTCSPLNPAVVDIPLSYEVRGYEFTYRQKSLRIFSNQTLTVLAWSYRDPSYSAALVHPACNEIKYKSLYTYRIMSTKGLNDNWLSQFLIISCQDDSNVTIVPSQNISIPLDIQNPLANDTRTITTGESHSVVLQSMQTLLITSHLDLTSSKVTSNKPLSVISGAQCAQFPNGINSCDFLMNQVPPTDQWGRKFFLSPHKRRPAQAYKILANTDNTFVVMTCNESAITNYTLNSGQSVVFFTNGSTYCSVISTEPIYMAQFGVSDSYYGNNIDFGDPTLSNIPPVEQHVNSVQFTAIPDGGESYYSIVIQNDVLFNQSIVLDGTLQNITSWKTIHNSNGAIVGYGNTSEAFNGTHIIAHPNTDGVLSVIVYGWGFSAGYSYSAGYSARSSKPMNKPSDDNDGMVSCTTECNPQYSELQYEVCCDPDNFGNFVTVVKSDTHIAYVACPAVAPDWCAL